MTDTKTLEQIAAEKFPCTCNWDVSEYGHDWTCPVKNRPAGIEAMKAALASDQTKD